MIQKLEGLLRMAMGIGNTKPWATAEAGHSIYNVPPDFSLPQKLNTGQGPIVPKKEG